MNSVIASLIAEWYGETNILGISFVQWSDLFLIFVSQPGGDPTVGMAVDSKSNLGNSENTCL